MFVVENIEQMLVISLSGWTPQIRRIILIKPLERWLSILPLAAVPYEDYRNISRMFVTNGTPTGVRTCREGRDEMTSPAGRLTACLMHVGRTSDWHGCEARVE